MAMVSMKMKPEQYVEGSPNPYGYGLCLYLSEEQVEVLGLDKNPPAAGTQVGIRGVAMVRRVTQEADPVAEAAEGEAPDDIDVCLELQVTDLEVTPQGGMSMGSASAALYGS
jgi:hypothetical protein